MTRALTLAAIGLCLASGLAMAGQVAPAPSGGFQFCIRNPSFCSTHAPANSSDMALIQLINRKVNDRILPDPLSTAERVRAENGNWRVVLPEGLGGCIEYTLTKYMLLAWGGIPVGAMRFAQVRAPGADENHAVLLVRVKGVEVVLDNLTPVIWPADLTHYEWIAVQDETNGMRWIKPEGAPK